MSAPWLLAPAGLSSPNVQRSANRGTSCIDDRQYISSALATSKNTALLPAVDASLRTQDINGARPSHRPIPSSSETPAQFRTSRHTHPLNPDYHLPQVPSTRQPVPTSRPSSSLMTSDIEGATGRSKGPSPFTTMTKSCELFGTSKRLFQGKMRTLRSLDITDIPGASTQRSMKPNAITPGMGTLKCYDIKGAVSGNHSGIGACSTFTLGRWPPPSAYGFEFSQQPRNTLIQKPLVQAP